MLLWSLLAAIAVVAMIAVPAFSLFGGLRQFSSFRAITKADDCLRADDLQGALEALDRAAEKTPDNPLVFENRGQVRLELGDLVGAMADFNRLIELNPAYSGGYTGRAAVYQRLDRHREAIDDFTKAIELRPEWEPSPRNNRAYARALGKRELDQGLSDVEEAIRLDDKDEAAYYDTRGYLHELLGEHEAALADLDRAVELAERDHRALEKSADEAKLTPKQRARMDRLMNEELGVILHHRGLAHQALGHGELAKQDLSRGDQLGYSPKDGVF